jgi:hypothetical protein
MVTMKTVWIVAGVVLLAAGVVGIGVLGGRAEEKPVVDTEATPKTETSAWPVIEVYKDPTCGCCSKWVEHLQGEGFTVRSFNAPNLAALKVSHGVPSRVQSCHTALVDGYVIEGHVPAADVRRLLTERPSIAGLAVPGMPIGSPGMEAADGRTQPYDVIAFDKDDRTRVYAEHGR